VTRIFLFLGFIRRAFQCDTMHHGGCSQEALLSINHDRPPRRAVRRTVFYYLLRCRPSARAGIMFTSADAPARPRPSMMMLDILRTSTSLGDGAFAVAGPRVWSSLPPAIRDPSLSLSVFGELLKTYCLFKGRGAGDL